jgi:hypothetical protein
MEVFELPERRVEERRMSIQITSSAVSSLDRQEGGEHYKSCKIQPITFIHANNLNFLEGSVIKRVCRHRRKNGAEDLRKAIHELELMLELEYNEKP